MQMFKRVVFLLALCGPFIFTICETSRVASGGPYHVTAYKPNDPSKVVVKVSLSKQNVYVMEGDRCLMAVACSVGIPSKPTPRGNFTIYRKEEDKRSGSYGFRVQGDRVVPAEAGSNIPGRYVGYPMGFWCCIRLKGEAAPKFYGLVHNGTPVHIATTQPEDETLGPKVKRVDDSRAPDPDPHISITSAAFEKPSGPLLE
ncbi:MAG: L,D-transpeptidase [Verrucomicrobia bacterium]|nr:MAG: L,D-transpeptidase [Verrucomicrobiota bacterium]